MVSTLISQNNRLDLLGEMANSKTGAGNTHDEPRTSNSTKNKKKKLTMRVYQKDTETISKVSSGQIWNNMSSKVNTIVLDYNPRYKINNH